MGLIIGRTKVFDMYAQFLLHYTDQFDIMQTYAQDAPVFVGKKPSFELSKLIGLSI